MKGEEAVVDRGQPSGVIGRMTTAVALAALVLALASKSAAQPPEGKPVPPFSLPTLDGGEITIKVEKEGKTGKTRLAVLLHKKVKGKIVQRRLRAKALLVVHWAGWNSLSVRLLKQFAPLCRKFAKRGLVAVAINLFAAEGERKIGEVTKGMPYIVVLDPVGLTTKPFRVSEMPVTTLVDSQGIVRVTRRKCYPGILAEFEKWLSDLLGPPSKSKKGG